jgi:hypothetical protein
MFSAQSAASGTNSTLIRLRAFATSGLPVRYTLLSGDAILMGDTVQPKGLGEVRIRAVQEGDAFFKPAQSVDQRFYVVESPRSAQTISFSLPERMVIQPTPIALVASASSGLPVSFSIVSGPARIVSAELLVEDSGTVIVKAVQDGSNLFEAASVQRAITFIRPPEVTISMSESALTLNWAPDDLFMLEMANTLEGPWEKVPEVPATGTFSISRLSEPSARFYRLVTEKGPQ